MSWSHLGPFARMGWVDAVDILVLSFLIHRLYVLFRGTTTLQILVGLACLWIGGEVARELGLVLTTWLFDSLTPVAVFALIVIFRHEIREALLHTSPVRLFLGRAPEAGLERLPALIEGIFRLAKDRVGALIVFQNRDRVREHVREGVRLDALYSPQALASIFSKEGPIHDGAAIVRGDRIDRAGVFLPLSYRGDLPEEFGTRHRAAVGLSEACDAVVVVVSEERGEVSVVYKGMVDRVAEPSHLEEVLRRVLRLGLRRRGRFDWAPDAVRQLTSFLLIGMMVAGGWWIYSSRQVSLITVDRPIDFRNLAEDLELDRPSDFRVEVQVRGKAPLIAALKPEQVVVFVDLTGAAAGPSQRFALGEANVERPPGLEVVRIDPPDVLIDLEGRNLAREVPIAPRVEGRPPEGYRLEVAVNPPTVTVLGPRPDVEGIEQIATEPVPLGDLSPAHPERTADARLVLAPASVRLPDGRSRRVRVTLRLVQGEAKDH